VRSLLAPPTFESDERTRVAGLTYAIALITMAGALAFGVFWPILGADLRPMLIAALIFVTGVGALVLTRQGRIRLAGGILVAMVWLGMSISNWRFGGVRDVGFGAYFLIILLGGLLLGPRGAWGVALMSILAGLWFAYAESIGVLPADVDTPFEVLFDYAIYFLIGAALLHISNRGLQRVLQRSRQSEQELRERNIELRQIQASLEQRVAERTEDLARRSRYLEAAAEVAYAAGEILDIDQLIDEAVNLILEDFDLYYVGLFTVDESETWAILRAGTGQAGAAMLARGHRIQVGEGMIGWSIEHGQSRVAQRAEADVVRLATPELPETRAEAALPLRSRDQVLGALSVQSTQVDYFDPDTVIVLQTMADLVAVALDNAQLFAEREGALQAARRAYTQGVQEAWEDLLQKSRDWGYRYENRIVRPVQGAWRSEMWDAIEQDQEVQVQQEDVNALAIPIRSAGRVIGVFNFRRRGEETWAPDEVAFLRALVGQVEQALENARLLAETRRRAARDQQLGEISDSFSRAIDVTSMLQAAVRELGQLPGVVEAAVHLDVPASDSPGDAAGTGEE
jgi:GAF domain-containing protein